MNNETLVVCGCQRLHRVRRRGPRPSTVRFKYIQDFDDGVAMLGEGLLGHLDVHLGTMLLETELRMLFKPPRGNLSLADAAKNWQWRGMVSRVVCALLGETSQIMSQDLGANAQRFHEHFWKIDGNFTDDGRPNHPHSLDVVSLSRKAVYRCKAHMTLGTRCSVIDHDALGFEVQDLTFLGPSIYGRGRERCSAVCCGRPGASFLHDGVRAQLDREAGDMTSRIVLADRLDGIGESVGSTIDNVQHGLPNDLVGQGADDILPRGCYVAYVALEINVHDDVQTVFGRLLEVLALLSHILADGALHIDAVAASGSSIELQGRDGRWEQCRRPGVGGHGGHGGQSPSRQEPRRPPGGPVDVGLHAAGSHRHGEGVGKSNGGPADGAGWC